MAAHEIAYWLANNGDTCELQLQIQIYENPQFSPSCANQTTEFAWTRQIFLKDRCKSVIMIVGKRVVADPRQNDVWTMDGLWLIMITIIFLIDN